VPAYCLRPVASIREGRTIQLTTSSEADAVLAPSKCD
jgi:hypothetical protein